MRTRHFSIAAVVFVAVSTIGCYPAKFVTIPAFGGQVVDADGAAVPKAKLKLTSYPYSTLSPGVESIGEADASGYFSREAMTQMGLFIAMADRTPGPQVRIVAVADGLMSDPVFVGDRQTNEIFAFGFGRPKRWDAGRLVLRHPTTQP